MWTWWLWVSRSRVGQGWLLGKGSGWGRLSVALSSYSTGPAQCVAGLKIKEGGGFRAWPRVGVRNTEWGAVQGQWLTVQLDSRLDLGSVSLSPFSPLGTSPHLLVLSHLGVQAWDNGKYSHSIMLWIYKKFLDPYIYPLIAFFVHYVCPRKPR